MDVTVFQGINPALNVRVYIFRVHCSAPAHDLSLLAGEALLVLARLHQSDRRTFMQVTIRGETFYLFYFSHFVLLGIAAAADGPASGKGRSSGGFLLFRGHFGHGRRLLFRFMRATISTAIPGLKFPYVSSSTVMTGEIRRRPGRRPPPG
jgi:hypothetical protein